MGKKLKKCAKQCRDHAFLLKPVHYSAVLTRELSASYCPRSRNAPSITPKFNKDNRHFTQAFFLPADSQNTPHSRSHLSPSEQYYLNEQERCLLPNGDEKSQLFIAKPREKYSFCSVCNDDYDDYLQHIEEEAHIHNIRENKFNGYIEELAEEMERQTREDEVESRFQNPYDTNLHFFTQESTHFEEKTPLEGQSYLQGFEYQLINNFFHNAKNFHFLKEHVESVVPENQEEPSLFYVPQLPQSMCGAVMSPSKPVVSFIINGGTNQIITN